MEQKAGAQISRRAFIQSLVILFVLMMIAGILTLVIPAGQYTRVEVDGRETIDPASFQFIDQPDYPVWRWFVAPFEVLGSESGLTVIVIIIVLFFAGGAFAVMDKTGTLRAFIGSIVRRFSGRKYTLLWMVSLAFMFLGATLGTFEEVVLLVPVMIALSYSLGWDALVGLGMSILATNMGFSAAISNPYTLGVAQQLAGLPLFSGAWLRIIIFAVIYLIFTSFLSAYARKIDKDPKASLVHDEDKAEREKYKSMDASFIEEDPKQNRAMNFFGIFVIIIFITMLAGPFVPAISDYALPLVGILFLIGGLGAGFLSGKGSKTVWQGLIEGWGGLAPSVPLILMAASIRFIIDSGGATDTILHAAADPFQQLGAFPAAVVVYALALGIEFFIASGSAKAFLMMPIVLPLADLIGVTRQTAVLAYIFGDGFSNLAYPTNPVLLISLGLTVVSYPKWLRWTAKLWLWVILATVAFLGVAVAINFGPF
ncbi:MAG: YfcC family protein [Anaerolineales bacterium]|uniref:YfcC family protein n=1 Tax=Candidatus Villigracilis vicinus TaxID=3140679 RepID=UPI0031354803|nr:YfcC family protein [Anaerolineales bacterium]MBK7450132.1 YfcC family protein [Anaerolineales bacterium]MBK9780215.1 YfcC family protein [Anaerolineales bacterium]